MRVVGGGVHVAGRLGRRPNGDAEGVLQAVIAHRAKNALLNKIVAEIELVLGATPDCVTACTLSGAEENAVSRTPD